MPRSRTGLSIPGADMPDIILCTLNSRFSHASLGMRYLLANMDELADRTALQEFVIGQKPLDMVERLLAYSPKIIGFGVYIWNVEETYRVIVQLKQIRPDIIVVLGGPEVSHETTQQSITQPADFVITGPGDTSFAALCRQLLKQDGDFPKKIIAGERAALDTIRFPYDLFDERDLAHRLLYVEASRGCPFKCEFCLSSLDQTAWPFPQTAFLAELERLYARGARTFKFVDRTFNLNVRNSLRILEFFLERLSDDLFVHFEVIPDHLPEALKQALQRFPAGTLQLEVGIQTFNPQVQSLISRRQNNQRSETNLRWLREHTQAHLHVDLIAGLPGEDLDSFASGFNRLYQLNPHEIQVGLLKRLRGTPIARHCDTFAMKFNPLPPYNILATQDIGFADLQRLGRFARFWDLIGNSGRFARTLPTLLADTPFERFMAFADWLWQRTGQTHQIALERLYDLLFEWLLQQGASRSACEEPLLLDYRSSGARGAPAFLKSLTRAA